MERKGPEHWALVMASPGVQVEASEQVRYWLPPWLGRKVVASWARPGAWAAQAEAWAGQGPEVQPELLMPRLACFVHPEAPRMGDECMGIRLWSRPPYLSHLLDVVDW